MPEMQVRKQKTPDELLNATLVERRSRGLGDSVDGTGVASSTAVAGKKPVLSDKARQEVLKEWARLQVAGDQAMDKGDYRGAAGLYAQAHGKFKRAHDGKLAPGFADEEVLLKWGRALVFSGDLDGAGKVAVELAANAPQFFGRNLLDAWIGLARLEKLKREGKGQNLEELGGNARGDVDRALKRAEEINPDSPNGLLARQCASEMHYVKYRVQSARVSLVPYGESERVMNDSLSEMDAWQKSDNRFKPPRRA